MVTVQDPHLRTGARLLPKRWFKVNSLQKKEGNCLPNLGAVQTSIMAAAAKSGFQNKKKVT